MPAAISGSFWSIHTIFGSDCVMDGGLGCRVEGYGEDAIDFGAGVEEAASQLLEAVLPEGTQNAQGIFLSELICQAAQTAKRLPCFGRLHRRFPW